MRRGLPRAFAWRLRCVSGFIQSHTPIERPRLSGSRRLRLIDITRENMSVQRRLEVAEHRIIDAQCRSGCHERIAHQGHIG